MRASIEDLSEAAAADRGVAHGLLRDRRHPSCTPAGAGSFVDELLATRPPMCSDQTQSPRTRPTSLHGSGELVAADPDMILLSGLRLHQRRSVHL